MTVPGNLTIGDGSGVAASVALLGPNQIADQATVAVASDGTFNVGANPETITNLFLGSANGGGTVTGTGTITLNGNLTTVATATPSTIAPTLALADGTHQFNVARGSSVTSQDLVINGPVGGSPSAVLQFVGAGFTTMQGLAAPGAGFVTQVLNGQLNLNATVATTPPPTVPGVPPTVPPTAGGSTTGVLPGNVTIGGAGNAAVVREFQSDQIADTALVTLAGNGTLDLSGLATDESDLVLGLSGTDPTAQVILGPGQLLLRPTVAFQYAGSVTGSGRVVLQSSGTTGASQEFSGPINLSGQTYGPYSFTAVGGGQVIIDSTTAGGGGGATTGAVTIIPGTGTGGGTIATTGTVSGTGSLTNLQLNPGGTLQPGTYPASLAGTSPSAGQFVPGTITTQTLDIEGGIFAVPITGVSTSGQVSVVQSITSAPGTTTELRVTLPTGFSPTGGQAFTIVNIVPSTVFLLNSTGFSGFTDSAGRLLTEGSTFTAFNGTAQFVISYVGGDGNDVVIYNTQAPSVTLTRDPVSVTSTTGTMATFLATFSGPVGPINPTRINVATTGNVTFTGAIATQAVVNGVADPTQYQIVVSGLAGTGTITVSLPQGAALSLAGTPTQPSSSPNRTNVLNVNTIVPPSPPPPPTPGGSGSIPGGRMLVGAGPGGNGAVNVYSGQPVPSQSLSLPSPQFASGARVASGDFNQDGVRDFVFATGPGVVSFVEVIDGATGATLFTVQPFENQFVGGVNISAGDINGDGIPDVVVSPDLGGGPRVKVFTGAGFGLVADFLAINDLQFRGGVRTAVGDISGDGIGDLVVAAGFGGGPRVATYNGATVFGAFGRPPSQLTADFFAFESALRNGAFVAVVDVNGDGFGDVVAGGGPGGGPRITVYDGKALLTGGVQVVSNFFAGDPNGRGGVRLAAADYDGNGALELATGAGEGDGSGVQVYVPATLVSSTPIPLAAFDAFPGFTGGVFVG